MPSSRLALLPLLLSSLASPTPNVACLCLPTSDDAMPCQEGVRIERLDVYIVSMSNTMLALEAWGHSAALSVTATDVNEKHVNSLFQSLNFEDRNQRLQGLAEAAYMRFKVPTPKKYAFISALPLEPVRR